MRFNQAAHGIGRRVRRSLEGREANLAALRVNHAERAVVRADQRDGPLKHQRSDLAEVRARVERVGNLKQGASRLGLALLVRVEPRVLIADRNLPRDGLQKRDFIIEPGARRSGVVQADETEHVAPQNHRHDEQRACSQGSRQKAHFVVQAWRARVVQANRLRQVHMLCELSEVEGNGCAEARRHVIGGAPLVADAKLRFGRELNHVATVSVHHAPKLRDHRAQESVQVYRGRQVQREAIYNRLPRFVHFNLAFERE